MLVCWCFFLLVVDYVLQQYEGYCCQCCFDQWFGQLCVVQVQVGDYQCYQYCIDCCQQQLDGQEVCELVLVELLVILFGKGVVVIELEVEQYFVDVVDQIVWYCGYVQCGGVYEQCLVQCQLEQVDGEIVVVLVDQVYGVFCVEGVYMLMSVVLEFVFMIFWNVIDYDLVFVCDYFGCWCW